MPRIESKGGKGCDQQMTKKEFADETTTAQRCRSETEKNILEVISSSVLSQFKKYHPWKPEI